VGTGVSDSARTAARSNMHPYIEEKYYSEEEDADEELEYLDSNPAIVFIVTVQRRSGVYTWVVFAPISGYIHSII